MKKLFISLWLVLLIILFCANLTAAQNTCPPNAICIPNPVIYNDFPSLIQAIVKFLQQAALVITAIVIVLSGYYFVTSMGDPAKVSQAKKMLLYALIGLLIILMAQGIIQLIQVVFQGGSSQQGGQQTQPVTYVCTSDNSKYAGQNGLSQCQSNCSGSCNPQSGTITTIYICTSDNSTYTGQNGLAQCQSNCSGSCNPN